MTKNEVDAILDSFTNSMLFKQDDDGNFLKDNEGNLIRIFDFE